MFFQRAPLPQPTVEEVRKRAQILVIDDQEWPAQGMFERDGYHVTRWAEIKNLSQLTDGHFHLILLDVNGVGLLESPDLQGLGVLDHIKRTNPAQTVIVYSAQSHNLTASLYAARADAVMDKSTSYIDFKSEVDQLLMSRTSPDYFIAAMNRELGQAAAVTPRAVTLAMRAMRTGKTNALRTYLADKLNDSDKADFVAGIITVGIATLRALTS